MAPSRLRPLAAAARGLACLAAASLALAPSASAQGPVDLTPIFAPPSPAELQAVRLDWAARPHEVVGFRLEAAYTDLATGARYEVISHVVDGFRHYGGIRFPGNYVPGQKYPVMLICHGSTNGLALEDVSNIFLHFPAQCVASGFFSVMPSFRSEPLETLGAGTFVSGGTRSWADRDVDDTRALLSAALDHQPDMDRARITAWGISRGAAVSLLLAIRDDRIRRVVDMFGFTDMSLPSVVGSVDAIVNAGAPADGLPLLVYEDVVAPYLTGAATLAEARLSWIRRSSSYFVAGLPPLTAHHGLQDTAVDATHTQALLDALAAFGADPSSAQGHYYPTGLHGLNSLPGHGPIVESFLCAVNAGPSGYCGPMAIHGGGATAAIDYNGSISLEASSFRLRVHRALPMSVGLFFIAPTFGYTPSGAGYLCLGNGLQRVGATPIDPTGFAQFALDVPSLPVAAQALIAPGATAYFQFVFRDNNNPNGTWNFTNGLRVTFEP